MKCRIDREVCIGAGNCAAIAPEYFEMEDQGLAREIKNPVEKEHEDLVFEAAESSPVDAVILEDDEGDQLYP